jgi:adenylate kinase
MSDDDEENNEEEQTITTIEPSEEIDISNRRVPKIIISGGPASGKGTQCDFIVKEWNVVHLSSGDMLRAAIESGSEEGKQAQEYMNTGKLVPDELIINIVAHRVMEKDCRERGFVLDGFPRTAVQVQALMAAGVQCDVFLQIDVDDEAIVQRVAGRRMDPETGKIYHMTYLPPPADIVHRLQQRADDTEEKIKVRLATYHRNLAGIINNFELCTVTVNTNNKNPHQIWREFRQKMKRYLLFHVIFVLGAPSSGKSVLCQEVARKCDGYRCISVPNLVAAEADSGSDEGAIIKPLIAAGKDIPIDVVIKLISKEMFHLFNNSPAKLSKVIIDGFPNTSRGVERWYEVMGHCASVDFFLYLNASADILLPRLQEKVVMSKEGATNLIARYQEDVAPLLASLDRSGKLRTLDALMNPKILVKEVNTLLTGVSIINPFERTFAIIKPDAVSDGKAHEIHRALIADGRLTVLASKLVHFDGKATEEFYVQELKDSSKKNNLKSFMSSGPSLCMILEGPDAVKVWRAMMGPTDSRVAVQEAPRSFRALYGSDDCRNAVHGSDCEGSALREIDFLLAPNGSGQRLTSVVGPKADLNPLRDDCISSFSREEKSSGGLVLEETCAVLKPLTADLYYDEIIAVVRSQGFEIISELKTQLTDHWIRDFYAEHKDKEFFEQLVAYMCSRRVVSLRLRRVGAISAWRNLMGSVDLEKCKLDRPDSLRSLFAIDNTKNAVGGSDSLLSAKREILRYFSFGRSAEKVGCGVEDDVLLHPPPKITLPPIVGSPSPQPLPVKTYKSPYELEPISRGDMASMNSYNKAQIHPVLGPVISKLIMSRPKDVKEFILNELQSSNETKE